jgi:conjugative transposon TraN protein
MILIGMMVLLAIEASSQPVSDGQTVEVTFNKTSSLVFSSTIKSVDRGSRDVLAQKAKGIDNVLQLKAARTNFKETNLTVITADGRLHHFFVRYAEEPNALTNIANESENEIQDSFELLFQTEMTEAEMERYAQAILDSPRKFRLKSASKFDMRLSLQGIYIRDNIMFYHLKVSNRSNVPYHTDVLRFYIKDRQKVKRTASQEVSETPLYYYGNASVIDGKSTQDLVYAIPKFTIPDAKELTIELMEKRGGRHLELDIRNKTIVKAQPVKY